VALLAVLVLSACARPSAEVNVLLYLVERHFGGPVAAGLDHPRGALAGQVLYEDEPAAGVTVLVAERTGEPYAGLTGADGRYRIEGIPAGHYVPAAVGPGFREVALATEAGLPQLVMVEAGTVTEAPVIHMERHVAQPLPAPLPQAVDLRAGEPYTVAAPFPEGAVARVQAFTFERAGVTVDTLRLYQPLDADDSLPMIFTVWPGTVGGWEPVSVALAHAGYTLVAISPMAAHGITIEEHTQDARVALALARGGHLGVDLADVSAVALGASFSSPIMHRLLRDDGAQFEAWITGGGISNTFRGAAAFYAGRIAIPTEYEFAIPALGPANLYPLTFLRYSPVYTAAQLLPTLIIHTEVDVIVPIEQAYELEAALRSAGVPVDVFYYVDASHYLQVGEDLAPVGEEMYEVMLEFVERQIGERR
jgi:fermentation-respiration switch protein FrsA (DUF1100 family)